MSWYDLDPRIAIRDLEGMNKQQLFQVAYQARNPEVRRSAILRIGDPELTRAFAKEDPSPIVRRRLVRELRDMAVLAHIANNDADISVRETALGQIEKLQLY